MKTHPSFNNNVPYSLAIDVIGSLLPKKYKDRDSDGFESDHWRDNFDRAFEIHYGFPVYFEEVSDAICKIDILLDQLSLTYFNQIIETIFSSGIYTTLKSFSEDIYINNIMIHDEDGVITLIF